MHEYFEYLRDNLRQVNLKHEKEKQELKEKNPKTRSQGSPNSNMTGDSLRALRLN